METEGDLPEVTWRGQGRDLGKAWAPKVEIPLALLPCFWTYLVPLDSRVQTPAQGRAGFQEGGDRGAIWEPPLEGAADAHRRPGRSPVVRTRGGKGSRGVRVRTPWGQGGQSDVMGAPRKSFAGLWREAG